MCREHPPYLFFLKLGAGGVPIAENRYPVHVVVRRTSLPGVRLLGSGPTADALREIGVFGAPDGPTVVGEGSLEEVRGGNS